MEREDKKGIFFGVIGVLTLIVAIIGASFAYFSLTTESDPNAITVNAASVKIVYEDGDQIAISELIPASFTVAQATLSREGQDNGGTPYVACKDDKGYTVCGVYDFSLTNNGESPVSFTATVEPDTLKAAVKDPETQEVTSPAEIGFSNLQFKLYEVGTDGSTTAVDGAEGTFSYSEFSLLGSSLEKTASLSGNGTTKNYRLFIWLNEAGALNDAEQGAVFRGTVKIDVIGSGENGQLSGTVNGVE